LEVRDLAAMKLAALLKLDARRVEKLPGEGSQSGE
jgi:hypothetical protein